MNGINFQIKMLFPIMMFFNPIFFSTPQFSIRGKWISNIDPKSIVLISKNKYTEIYNQDTLYSGEYHRDNFSCDTSYLNNKKSLKVDFLKVADGRCFEIVNITDHFLSLRYTSSSQLIIFHKDK